jgi:hypothetical protein
MSIEMIHLRKLLMLFYAEPRLQTSKLREDIRSVLSREAGVSSSGSGTGQDFYGCFWADAKGHALSRGDLHGFVQFRVERSAGRRNLYPKLRDGFLQWWDKGRRWTNEPFRPIPSPHARFALEGLGTVKIENVLAVRDAANADHFVYPYFSPEPALSEEAARLGLWLMRVALPAVNINEMRILDVIRGRTFSVDRQELQGDEEAIFRRRYTALRRRWQELRDEYP